MKRKLAIVLSFLLILSLAACGKDNAGSKSEGAGTQGSAAASTSGSDQTEEEQAKEPTVEAGPEEAKLVIEKGLTDWVTTNLAAFYDTYGKDGSEYSKDAKPYVVFDFDNTCSIFDVEEQLAVYQLLHMAFAFTPEEAEGILMSEVPADTVVESDADYLQSGENSELTYNNWAKDCAGAYANLYEKYEITAAGIKDEAMLEQLHEDGDWKEFSAKMRAMYDVIYDNLSADIAYPWVLYWFTGMTEQEVYDLAYASHTFFGARDFVWHKETFASPEDYVSTLGPATYTWNYGITVDPEIVTIYKDLKEHGFDVYVCSASFIDVIRAGVDAFGLADYCDGVIAMTLKLEGGVYQPAYDYEAGYSYWRADGAWIKGDVATQAQTQGIGKVTAVSNVLCSKYGYGPSAGFMDSTGDFNFCTEYGDLKLVLTFNRLRKATDGGGIIQCVAMKQEADGVDLAKANGMGDVLYLVNGRDENGGYLIKDQGCIPLEKDYMLFKNENIEKLYDWYLTSDLSVGDFIDKTAIKTKADDAGNDTGCDYGFLKEYGGYRNIVF